MRYKRIFQNIRVANADELQVECVTNAYFKKSALQTRTSCRLNALKKHISKNPFYKRGRVADE